MNAAGVVHHKLRKRHNNRLHRLNLSRRSVAQRIHNVTFAVSNSSSGNSKTNNGG
jgi:hypothetical protein